MSADTSRPRIGHVRLDRLTPRQVQDLETNLLLRGRHDGSGLSPNTVRYVHRILCRALNQAVKSELVQKNVASLVDPPRAPRYESRSLTFGQALEFIESLSDPLRSVVLMAVQTGLRRSELLALQWQDVNFENGSLSVRRSLVDVKRGEPVVAVPKSGHGRVVSPSADVA